ncbi:hypothetical protein G3T36_02295 [Diaminobutyricibacter tongyongensis]|uniref:Uncharacterized protein n=1 Tax=Leifsonia tongyongensis TaxID=1268043 RepID=A0A6L9XTG5_9MICO|nr:hypothetical protein [Diaminobutyricibacter tongyongensis]NEN04691.1 hypothetical protein [Diaminobutyricibacter tongyongensis]
MGGHQTGEFTAKVGALPLPDERTASNSLPATHGVDGDLALDVLLCPEQASPWLPHPVPTDVALIPRKHHLRP